MTADARETVLGRIRAALQDRQPETSAHIAAEWKRLSRDYEQADRLSVVARLDRFEERLRDYDAEVTRIAEADIAASIASILNARNIHTALLPQGFPSRWTPAGINFTTDAILPSQQLDLFPAVVTAATVAIAETGSFVLQNVPAQGRRAATLIPDFHLCVVLARNLVGTVPEAFSWLAPSATLPTTFVSGPSATADIEMTRIKGVHGPRHLHVLLVLDQKP